MLKRILKALVSIFVRKATEAAPEAIEVVVDEVARRRAQPPPRRK